jgi:gas vesicle protein
MNEHNDSGFNAGHVFLALMGGALAGAGVAYLTAPAAGVETRQRMRGMAHEANLAVHHMPEALRRATEAAREAFTEALELEEGTVTAAKSRVKQLAKGGGKSKR